MDDLNQSAKIKLFTVSGIVSNYERNNDLLVDVSRCKHLLITGRLVLAVDSLTHVHYRSTISLTTVRSNGSLLVDRVSLAGASTNGLRNKDGLRVIKPCAPTAI